MLKKLRSLEYSNFYPLFFTVVFILILIQYSFHSLDAVFYDWWVRFDIASGSTLPVVVVELDEESDQFLGENYPYTYATHSRFIERITKDRPSIISYLLNLQEPESLVEQNYQNRFRDIVHAYTRQKGDFRFGTDIEGMFGELLPPEGLKNLGYSPAFLFVDSTVFSRDELIRRAILSVSGEDSLHLWISNKYREKMGGEKKDASGYMGSTYNPEADANFALFKYATSPVNDESIETIPFHRVVVGNYPDGFFKDKIVLVGTKYISNVGDFSLTPFNKDEMLSPKLKIHANIISALYNNKTIYPIPDSWSHVLALFLSLILSFVISKVQPTRGLLITIGLMIGAFVLGYGLFVSFGFWLKLSHIILSIFVVYYIWVPFRAIEEYQTRYAIQEEAKLLKQVDNLKQNFISLMSHDLKTPVAKIAGIADILRIQYPNTDAQKGLLDNIILSTKELNSFITSILDLTKIESQNLTLKKESKDVNKLVEAIAEKLRFEASTQNMTLETELSPLYPIQIDVILMNRVFSNLVENAIKYAGKDKEVRIKTWDEKEWVYVEISDNGVGIKEEDLQHIFDKFYRVKNDSTHSIKGSGLGLYLVKYFIELHDGTIEAKSDVGAGTKFIIKLKNE